MRVLAGAAVCALLLLAGCGGQQGPTATDDDPTESPTPSASASATPTEPAAVTPTASPSPAHTPSPRTPKDVVETIPDDFPLLDGYPAEESAEPEEHYGRAGPSRSTEPVLIEACGAKVTVPEHTDWLRAGWTNPEDYRQRQLVAFADAGRAQGYADDVLDLYRACPEEVTSEEVRESLHSTVELERLGDFSGVITSAFYYDYYPHPGMVIIHVVRVGTAVLVSFTYNEAGGGGYPNREAAEQRNDSARQIAGVVDAMRLFGMATPDPSEPAFGPEGFGRVTLGLSRSELLAVPGVRVEPGNDQCDSFEAPGVAGFLQPGFGVGAMSLTADASTPEGIQIGSTYDEVREAYPDAEGDRILLAADPPGFDDRYYRFELGSDERVDGLKLVHDEQHCAG